MADSMLDEGTETGSDSGTQVAPVDQGGQKLWYDSLPDDLKSDPSIIKFKDTSSLAKSYLHLQKNLGGDRINLPGENATDEDWKQVYSKLGVPENIADYKVDAPEGLDENVIGKLKEAAHKAGILPKQYQQLLNQFAEVNKQAVEEFTNNSQQTFQESQAALKREWGPGYDKNINLARAAVRDLGGEEAFKVLNDSGLANNPIILKMLAKAGETLGEDAVKGSSSNSLEVTGQQAQDELNQIMTNKDRPYWKGNSHPGYEKDKARILYLQGVLSGEVQ